MVILLSPWYFWLIALSASKLSFSFFFSNSLDCVSSLDCLVSIELSRASRPHHLRRLLMRRLHCLFLPRRWQYPCLCARPGNSWPLLYSWCCWIDVLIPTLLQFSVLMLMLSHYAKRGAGVRITDRDALLFGMDCVSREKEVALALLVLAH